MPDGFSRIPLGKRQRLPKDLFDPRVINLTFPLWVMLKTIIKYQCVNPKLFNGKQPALTLFL